MVRRPERNLGALPETHTELPPFICRKSAFGFGNGECKYSVKMISHAKGISLQSRQCFDSVRMIPGFHLGKSNKCRLNKEIFSLKLL